MTIPGSFPEAEYRSQEVPNYQGNRFIEALPPILEKDEAAQQMLKVVRATDAQRATSVQTRLHLLDGIAKTFHQPLDVHMGLFANVSVLIRGGYVNRNPARPEFMRQLLQKDQFLDTPTGLATPRQNLGAGSGHALIGMSGVGKSTAIEAVLGCYPQVIQHSNMNGPLCFVLQVVWLKLSCPHDGTIKGLCLQFFQEMDMLLGTDYTKLYTGSRATVDDLQTGMARVAFVHGLGLLVVDEIQNLNEAKSGGDRLMMNFLKILRDNMKVPVLAIGTKAAIDVLGGGFQVARRHAGMPIFNPMQMNEEFELFCESLFEAQYVELPVKLNLKMLDLIYELSQGVTDLIVKLFVSAQSRAIECGTETLSNELLHEVYNDTFGLLHPFLEAMRQGQEVDDRKWDRTMLNARQSAWQAQTASQDKRRMVRTLPRASGSGQMAPGSVRRSADHIGGVPKRRRKADEGSACVLVQVVGEANRAQVSPLAALVKQGFIQDFGAKALRS